MLRQAFLLSFLLVWGVRGDFFSGFFDNPESHFQFDLDQVASESRNIQSDQPNDDNREPLAPDYKDPKDRKSGNGDKPVLQPTNQKPKKPESSMVGGGIVDIDASNPGGFPSFGSFKPEFNFPSLPGMEGVGSTTFGFGSLFGITLPKPSKNWWEGKNVCVEREESIEDEDKNEDTNKKETEETVTENSNSTGSVESVDKPEKPKFLSAVMQITNCFEDEKKYECNTKTDNHGVVKTFTVRYKCCYGFKRTPGSDGCTEQVDLKPIMEILDDLKLSEFKHMIKSSNLESTFDTANHTIFVPSDDAIRAYDEKMNEINRVDPERRRRQLKHVVTSKDLILSHSTGGFLETHDLENEQVLLSEDEQKSPIRINIYPTHTYEKMMTANCARISKSNILATNGILHIVDRVVAPATQSVEQIIENHPKLSSFRNAMKQTEIPSKLKPDGHYTVFAATDEAFAKLDEPLKQKIIRGEGCVSNILKHHFVSHTICSAAIIGNATAHNVEGVSLNMERNEEDELIFESKAKIIETDIIATNGVIHLIDTLIIPESGQHITDVLKSQNFSRFQDLVERAGLTDEINNYNNATVFVPDNKAFENPRTEKILKEIGDDKEKLKKLVKYHILDGQLQSRNMENNMKIASKDNEHSLRINLYSTLPLFSNSINRATVNCARMVGFDEKTCGSIVHEVSKVLVPPTQTIYDLIQSEEKYSTLRELMKDTEVEKILQETNRSMTFLAPTDETFAALDERDLSKLREDKERAEDVLKNHILTEVLCCSGVGPHTWGFNSYIPTMGSQRVEVGRTGSQVRINRAVVTSCDNLATNGVLHTINKVLAPRRQAGNPFGTHVFYFGL